MSKNRKRWKEFIFHTIIVVAALFTIAVAVESIFGFSFARAAQSIFGV